MSDSGSNTNEEEEEEHELEEEENLEDDNAVGPSTGYQDGGTDVDLEGELSIAAVPPKLIPREEIIGEIISSPAIRILDAVSIMICWLFWRSCFVKIANFVS